MFQVIFGLAVLFGTKLQYDFLFFDVCAWSSMGLPLSISRVQTKSPSFKLKDDYYFTIRETVSSLCGFND